MGWFEVLLLVSGGVYLAVLLWLNAGLRRHLTTLAEGWPRVSVVVAARDEEAQIGACLDALQAQDYEGEWEVVVVDDRSTDQTARSVAKRSWDRLRLVHAPRELRFRCPKKSALAAGIAASQGELLLFTDADCQPPPEWVRNTVRLFAPGVGMVAGHAFPQPVRGLRQGLLALDNLAVGALGAGSMGMGTPLSCTGRNLAYRLQVYEQLGGFSAIGHLIGGDDVYFMRLVSSTPWRIVYNPCQVQCSPGPQAWKAILQQKLRHASKAGNYQGPARGLAGAVYLFHLLLLVGVAKLASGQADLLFLGVWALRWLADLALLYRFAPGARERRLLRHLPFLEVLYIPYVLVFTALGRLGWFRWK
ncbi:MAG: glycosyltransferase [Candidatus Latescibacteria bacterium]|nr:glycosyltransferase [Candidatus Latescibacterota bacterium]